MAATELVPKWDTIVPRVNIESEFKEIASDFGDPLEIVLEAISNSVDAGASTVNISFEVKEIDGARQLVISFEDNGKGDGP